MKIAIAALLLAVPFGLLIDKGAIPPSKEVSSDTSTPAAVENAKQLPPAPPGLPAAFRIQFATSAGETVDSVAEFIADVPRKDAKFAGDWTNPEHYMIWRTPAVQYTVDHPSLYTFTRQGPQTIKASIDLTYYPDLKYWCLTLGTGIAKIDCVPFFQPSTVPSRFSAGTISYFNMSIN